MPVPRWQRVLDDGEEAWDWQQDDQNGFGFEFEARLSVTLHVEEEVFTDEWNALLNDIVTAGRTTDSRIFSDEERRINRARSALLLIGSAQHRGALHRNPNARTLLAGFPRTADLTATIDPGTPRTRAELEALTSWFHVAPADWKLSGVMRAELYAEIVDAARDAGGRQALADLHAWRRSPDGEAALRDS